MDWKPIETAPKDGTEFLAFGSYRYEGDDADTIYHYVVSYANNETHPWEIDGTQFGPKFFSHWMPLPPPPSGRAALRERE